MEWSGLPLDTLFGYRDEAPPQPDAPETTVPDAPVTAQIVNAPTNPLTAIEKQRMALLVADPAARLGTRRDAMELAEQLILNAAIRRDWLQAA